MAINQPEPTLPLDSDFGPYHLLRLIAVGGMAEVYLARTRGVVGFEKVLALKVIHPNLAHEEAVVGMLIDEARLAVKLTHKNIASTFDLGCIGETYFISMEYVDGIDFYKLLRGMSDRRRDLPLADALFVVREVCEALEYAHHFYDDAGNQLQIVHRDVSPQNILLDRNGRVKLTDFGIAKAANLSADTKSGVIKGKLIYMSPEQSFGRQVDARTDIFSAGVVLYEALTGRSLYLETSPVKLLERVRKARIDPPSSRRAGLSAALDALVMKALAPDPAARYPSARAFANAIEGQLQEIAPGYDGSHLPSLVTAIADEQPIPDDAALSGGRPRRETMDRSDYAVGSHSVIFSAQDLLEPGPRVIGQSQDALQLVLLGQEHETYRITDQFVIGRNGDLWLADARVSRKHARIYRGPHGFVLEDLNSSNGTYLNGERLSGHRPLSDGDRIRIGPFEMEVRCVSEGAATGLPASENPVPRPADVLAIESTGDNRQDRTERTTPRRRGARAVTVEERAAVAPASPPLPTDPGADLAGRRRLSDLTNQARVGAADAAVFLNSQSLNAESPQPAQLVIQLDHESMVVEIDGELKLSHALSLDDEALRVCGGQIVWRSGAYWIEPADAAGPIELNGQTLRKPQALKTGDELLIGSVAAVFDDKH